MKTLSTCKQMKCNLAAQTAEEPERVDRRELKGKISLIREKDGQSIQQRKLPSGTHTHRAHGLM